MRIVGMCIWCGMDVYGTTRILGCEMICEECQAAEDLAANE